MCKEGFLEETASHEPLWDKQVGVKQWIQGKGAQKYGECLITPMKPCRAGGVRLQGVGGDGEHSQTAPAVPWRLPHLSVL